MGRRSIADMTILPASVRVALWSSAALAGRVDIASIPRHALPDMDHCDGLVQTVELWRDLGERVVVPALPRPGSTAGMPTGSAELTAAATAAGELVYVPGLGGAAVPRIEEFGPQGDTGWQALWQRYDADPMPIHRLQALDLPAIELQLRRRIGSLTEALERTDAPLLVGAGIEDGLRGGLDGDWGLPDGIPARAVRLIALSGRLAAVAEAGDDPRLHSAHAAATSQREMLLREVTEISAVALAESATVACLAIAEHR